MQMATPTSGNTPWERLWPSKRSSTSLVATSSPKWPSANTTVSPSMVPSMPDTTLIVLVPSSHGTTSFLAWMTPSSSTCPLLAASKVFLKRGVRRLLNCAISSHRVIYSLYCPHCIDDSVAQKSVFFASDFWVHLYVIEGALESMINDIQKQLHLGYVTQVHRWCLVTNRRRIQ